MSRYELRRKIRFPMVGIVVISNMIPILVHAQPAQQPLSFEREIVPILTAYCWKCHGGEALEGDLDMRTLPLLLKGGTSGPALVRGRSEESLIIEKIESGEMPPENALNPTNQHLELLRSWVDAGASAQFSQPLNTKISVPELTQQKKQWWAFQGPLRHPVPDVRNQDRVRTPVDAFLLDKLEAQGLVFLPDADPGTLVRRVFLDVIGLPPRPDQVTMFISDSSPESYERLIDQLLASPHYGERWGRHWLDAAGYVDSRGTDNDAQIIKISEGMWKYRDYVVAAFNEDKSYDQFLMEQIAGDERVDWRNAKTFSPEIKNQLIATGFLRQSADVTDEQELNTADIRYQVLFDTLQTFSTNILGLTVHCARCHDHKFDPISHLDYYRLAACFTPGYNVHQWIPASERQIADVAKNEKERIDANNNRIEKGIGRAEEQVGRIHQQTKKRLLEAKLEQMPEVIREDLKKAIQTSEDKRTGVQKYLLSKLGTQLEVRPEEIDRALSARDRATVTALKEQIKSLAREKRSYGIIRAFWEPGSAPSTYLFRRGEYTTPGSLVNPGVPKVLEGVTQGLVMPEKGATTGSSGRRLALANWLTQPDHPLTARVIVNRVWQQYFGKGIVETPDNFGRSGALPSHPKLLDWLACEFMDRGWSFKELHRRILRSSAYRQGSRLKLGVRKISDPYKKDPENRLLWRMPLRRLESEVIRDRVLATSGLLEHRIGGPPIPLIPHSDGSVEIDVDKLTDKTDQYRRSLYVFARRNYQLSELSVFDQPLVAHNCIRRQYSAVVLQSLLMVNGKFISDQAVQFSKRVIERAGSNQKIRVREAFMLAFCRLPTDSEWETSFNFLESQAHRLQLEKDMEKSQACDHSLQELCHMLLSANELLYVE